MQNLRGPLHNPVNDRHCLLLSLLSSFSPFSPSGQQVDTRVRTGIPQTLQLKPWRLRCWQREHWWSSVAFQRSQKSEARGGGEKREQPSGRRPCQHCPFLADGRQGSGLYQRIYLVSSPAPSHNRVDNSKDWARRLEREVSGAQTPCWE